MNATNNQLHKQECKLLDQYSHAFRSPPRPGSEVGAIISLIFLLTLSSTFFCSHPHSSFAHIPIVEGWGGIALHFIFICSPPHIKLAHVAENRDLPYSFFKLGAAAQTLSFGLKPGTAEATARVFPAPTD